MTDEEKQVLSRIFDIDFIDISDDENYKETSYIEKQQLKYIETHKKIEENDVLTSIRRGEYKEIFDNYINFCLEEGKKPKARHLFHIHNEIKTFFTTNIALDAFTNICNGEINYKEFFTEIDFEVVPTDNFSLITGNWGEYKNSNVNITYDKLHDILKSIEYAIEKEIHKIDILFLKCIDLIEKQENENTDSKKKALTDDDFNNYKNEYFTPQVIKDLIDAGQLGQGMINGKYKPTFEITDFMEWMSINGYEDYLKFGFFKKFIFYENTDGTIKQYLKPSNFGIKRQKKAEK
jgi:hypothetical protein